MQSGKLGQALAHPCGLPYLPWLPVAVLPCLGSHDSFIRFIGARPAVRIRSLIHTMLLIPFAPEQFGATSISVMRSYTEPTSVTASGGGSCSCTSFSRAKVRRMVAFLGRGIECSGDSTRRAMNNIDAAKAGYQELRFCSPIKRE